ncbi:hypothetical protein ACSPKE_001932 [Providencia stuartii]
MTAPLALGWVRAGVLLWPAFLPAADLDFSFGSGASGKDENESYP